MYNKRILEVAHTAIEEQLQGMPMRFDSNRFYLAFALHHAREYEAIVETYVTRGHDRAHAVQITHSQLMHTVNNKFDHLARKTADCPNPKGGRMSLWVRV